MWRGGTLDAGLPEVELGRRLTPIFKPDRVRRVNGIGGVLIYFGRGGDRTLDACHASEERGTLAARRG
jgi:hypothetical protein